MCRRRFTADDFIHILSSVSNFSLLTSVYNHVLVDWVNIMRGQRPVTLRRGLLNGTLQSLHGKQTRFCNKFNISHWNTLRVSLRPSKTRWIHFLLRKTFAMAFVNALNRALFTHVGRLCLSSPISIPFWCIKSTSCNHSLQLAVICMNPLVCILVETQKRQYMGIQSWNGKEKSLWTGWQRLGVAVKGKHSRQVLIALTKLQVGMLLFLPG